MLSQAMGSPTPINYTALFNLSQFLSFILLGSKLSVNNNDYFFHLNKKNSNRDALSVEIKHVPALPTTEQEALSFRICFIHSNANKTLRETIVRPFVFKGVQYKDGMNKSSIFITKTMMMEQVRITVKIVTLKPKWKTHKNFGTFL